MKTKIFFSIVFFMFAVFTVNAQNKYKAGGNTVVSKTYQGVTFTSEKSIAENVANLASFSFFNAMLDEDTLQMLAGQEMITVFVPSNAAFNAFDEEERDALLANKDLVAKMLKSHVIPGRVDSNSLKTGIAKNDGTIYYTTLGKERIGFSYDKNGQIVMFDSSKNKAIINAEDFMHSNGFFHVVNGLMLDSDK